MRELLKQALRVLGKLFKKGSKKVPKKTPKSKPRQKPDADKKIPATKAKKSEAQFDKNKKGCVQGCGAKLTRSPEKNLDRFKKKNPKAEIKVKDNKDGTVTFEAHKQADNIPGSKAVYSKRVDAQGNTVPGSVKKTTYAPDGSIVHTKPKG